jgi:hypothetical protein
MEHDKARLHLRISKLVPSSIKEYTELQFMGEEEEKITHIYTLDKNIHIHDQIN